MAYAAYVAAVAALVAGGILYRRWKARKPHDLTYGYVYYTISM